MICMNYIPHSTFIWRVITKLVEIEAVLRFKGRPASARQPSYSQANWLIETEKLMKLAVLRSSVWLHSQLSLEKLEHIFSKAVNVQPHKDFRDV